MAGFSYMFDICDFYLAAGSPGAGAVDARGAPAMRASPESVSLFRAFIFLVILEVFI